MVVVLLLSASDDVAIGTKPRAMLLPILGHLLPCCAKPHPYRLFKRYSFVCLFNATGNLIPDHWKRQTIISSLRQRFVRGYRCFLAAAPSMLMVSLRLSIPLPRPHHVLHMLACARTQIWIYLRDKQKRGVEMKFSGVSRPRYEMPTTNVPFDPLDKREGTI